MTTVAVIGLGYVGLPLVVEFGQRTRTIGFDIDPRRVAQCQASTDPSREIPDDAMRSALHAVYTSDPAQLRDADFILVAVPTPVDNAHIPDFGPLLDASRVIGEHMQSGAVVVYESTVYPGATEEVCIPMLERSSGKQWKRDFFVGYFYITDSIQSASFIKFVQCNNVSKIKHVNFFKLCCCSILWSHHIQTHVTVFYNLGITLSNTRCFNNN